MLAALLAALCFGLTAAQDGSYSDALEAYESGDYQAAMAGWIVLAEAGSAEARFNLGLMYSLGKGVEADPAEAAKWYRKAADQGFVRAQYNLAKLYEAGRGVRKDRVRAFMWFRLASDEKYADARKLRRKLAKQMTEHQIAQAELLAREWKRARKGGD